MKNLINLFSSMLIVLAALFLPKKSNATIFKIDITLSSDQSVPANPSTATGILTGTYNDATKTLSFNLMFNGLSSNTTAAHIHGPANAGTNAAVLISLVGFPLAVTAGSYSNSYVITAAQETELLSGLWYVNIHTSTYPGGEIRGQLKEGSSSAMDLTISAAQSVPVGASTGNGIFTGTYNDATNTLSFTIKFNGLTGPPTAAHIHGPAAAGTSTGVLIAFVGFPTVSTTGSYSNSYVLSNDQETQLLGGLWYVNIHTGAFPGGEIRGQLTEGSLPYYQPVPSISSFTPTSGPMGTSVIITGLNFNALPANNTVYFGAARATVVTGTTSSLTVTVPAGATYQPITVLDNATDLTGYSSKPFITTFANPVGVGIPSNYYKPKVDFATATNPRYVAAGDIDGDGKVDLLVPNGNANSVSVLRNISSVGNITAASLAAKVDFPTGTFTENIAVADVDGDGKLDLIVINNNNISVLRNTSTSGIIDATSFATKVDFDLVFTGPVFVATGDLNGDGKPELASSNSGANSSSVLRNTSTGSIFSGSFATKVDFSTGATPACVAIGDIDGDGKPDLVFANSSVGINTVSVLRNTSTAGSISSSSFAAKVDFATGTLPRSVVIGDVDGDGKPDLVVANSATAPASTTISVLRNTATPGSIDNTSFVAKVDFTSGTAPRSVAIGDIDGDGKPDILVANINSNNISVLRNTSTPGSIIPSSFAGKVDFTTATGPVSVAIVDLDGDGIPEVVAANGTSSSISVFQINPAALAVTLTNVKAYQKNAGVNVEWLTQQEINIDSYEVERSADGQNFIRVGRVRAAGNSSATTQYNLFDANPIPGVNFYRIKIIDVVHVRYSPVVRINITTSGVHEVNIYPNPVKGNNLGLQITLPKGHYIISLTNKLGQEIFTKTIEHAGGSSTESIALLKPLDNGVYQLKLSGEGISISRQLLIK